jgi:hypothetical protein
LGDIMADAANTDRRTLKEFCMSTTTPATETARATAAPSCQFCLRRPPARNSDRPRPAAYPEPASALGTFDASDGGTALQDSSIESGFCSDESICAELLKRAQKAERECERLRTLLSRALTMI